MACSVARVYNETWELRIWAQRRNGQEEPYVIEMVKSAFENVVFQKVNERVKQLRIENPNLRIWWNHNLLAPHEY